MNLKLISILAIIGAIRSLSAAPYTFVPKTANTYAGPFGFLTSCDMLGKEVKRSARSTTEPGYYKWPENKNGPSLAARIKADFVVVGADGTFLQISCPPQEGGDAWVYYVSGTAHAPAATCSFRLAVAFADEVPGPHFVPWLERLVPRNGTSYNWSCTDKSFPSKRILDRTEFIDNDGQTYIISDSKLNPIDESTAWSLNPKLIPPVFLFKSSLRNWIVTVPNLRNTSSN